MVGGGNPADWRMMHHMSLHQVRLRGAKGASQTVDRDAVRAFARGETELRAALGVGPEAVAALRRQAGALYAVGRHQACVDVLLGLGVLEPLTAQDVAMMAESFFALGQDELGQACGRMYEALLDHVEDALVHGEVAQ